MEVKYIKNNEIEIAFFPKTKRFYKINTQAKKLINAILDGELKSDIISNFNISEDDYNRYYDNIENPLPLHYQDNSCNYTNVCEKNNINVLNRLVIHLTNDCNMRCKYCYANGGKYQSDRGILTKEILDKTIEVFFNHFEKIYAIQFFGGEPLLNLPLMKYSCEKISQIAKKKGYEISFGVVVNGTLISQIFIDLVKQYKIGVTVSYDGHPLVNDMMRVFQNGTGSSEIILEKTKWLKEETGQPNTIEVTYNQFHVDNSIGILDVVKHIQEELPGTFVHLVPAGGAEDCDYSIKDLSIFPKSISEIFNIKKQSNGAEIPMYSLAQRIFSGIENRESNIPLICDAGLGTISVSITGDVYPCFMFTDNMEMCYGNVFDIDLFDSPQYNELQAKLNNFSVKSNNLECQNCFIKGLCNGCLGLNSFHSGNPLILSSSICNMFRDMTSQALIEYAKYLENKKKEFVEEEKEAR